jgi:hypothetical protein
MAPAGRDGWPCEAPITVLEHSVAATNSPKFKYTRPGRRGEKRFIAQLSRNSSGVHCVCSRIHGSQFTVATDVQVYFCDFKEGAMKI